MNSNLASLVLPVTDVKLRWYQKTHGCGMSKVTSMECASHLPSGAREITFLSSNVLDRQQLPTLITLGIWLREMRNRPLGRL